MHLDLATFDVDVDVEVMNDVEHENEDIFVAERPSSNIIDTKGRIVVGDVMVAVALAFMWRWTLMLLSVQDLVSLWNQYKLGGRIVFVYVFPVQIDKKTENGIVAYRVR